MKSVLIVPLILFVALPASAKDAPLYKTQDCGKYTAQMDLNNCAGNNYESADNALNALYKKIMASSLDQASKDGLRVSERAWIKTRDKICNDEAAPDEGGSIYNMDLANCLEDRTAARIRELKNMPPAP
jgi:uncharacterized protein YecT (DUF1311 family)